MKRSTWLNLLLGLWLMISPLVIFVINHRALRILWEDFLLGFGVVSFSIVRILSRRKPEMVFADWLMIAFGCLTLLNPILYKYGNAPFARWNNLLVGAAVLGSAVYQDWKDENRGHSGSPPSHFSHR